MKSLEARLEEAIQERNEAQAKILSLEARLEEAELERDSGPTMAQLTVVMKERDEALAKLAALQQPSPAPQGDKVREAAEKLFKATEQAATWLSRAALSVPKKHEPVLHEQFDETVKALKEFRAALTPSSQQTRKEGV